MVDFKVDNADLITFLEKCACKGVVLIDSAGKSTTKNFFKYFYLDVADNEICVKAVDSEEKRMYARHYLSGIEVLKPGVFGVTDVDLILSVIKKIPSSRNIHFYLLEGGNVLRIETSEGRPYYGYNIRQEGVTKSVEAALKNSKHGVGKWDDIHTFTDDDTPVPKITIGEESALYDTIISLSKVELSKILKDSIDLTKDQDIKFTLEKEKKIWLLKTSSGKKADNLISNTELEKEVENPVEFEDKMITNLHPIINHLFDDSTFYLRIAGDGALKFWVQSSDNNIELNFCSGSI